MRGSLILLAVCGCTGLIATPEVTLPGVIAGGETDGGPGSPGGPLTNEDVFTRLGHTCRGCHEMTERPFFQSLEAFENLIVYEPKWVVPGQPAASALLGLLRGDAGKQMPPWPNEMFAALEPRGLTRITQAELAEWITNLKPRTVVSPIDVPLVRRKTAEQVVATLYLQLGLQDSDFYYPSYGPLATDSYPVRSPDAIPRADAYAQGGLLFSAMGGPWRLEGKWRNDLQTSGFSAALIPVSQAFCRTAVKKPGNAAVLMGATLADSSATPAGAQAIRGNIARLYLKMLGEVASASEVDDLFEHVFRAYEPKGSQAAWTAVCAALVRDPLWILY